MAYFQVDTDIMRNGAATISGSGDTISQLANKISSLNNQIPDSYNGQLRNKVNPVLSQAVGDGIRLQGQAGKFSESMNSLATQIDEAMQRGTWDVDSLDGNVVNSSLSKFLGEVERLRLGLITTVVGLIGSLSLKQGANFETKIMSNETAIVNDQFEKTVTPVSTVSSSQKVIDIPFQSQWNGTSGGGNCGPASVTMAMNAYGKNIQYDDVVASIRKYQATGDTDFKKDYVKDLLKNNGLQEIDVKNLSELEDHITNDHPVIIAVDNSKYVRQENGISVPYPSTSGYLQPHIVVVTGFKKDTDGNIVNVLINDPLAVEKKNGVMIAAPAIGSNFEVPIDSFSMAVGSNWYAAAVTPL